MSEFVNEKLTKKSLKNDKFQVSQNDFLDESFYRSDEFEELVKKSGLNRRDALKLMGLAALFLVSSPTPARAMGPKIDAKGLNFVIAGGGAGGCTVANFISKNINNAKITIIEPNPQSVSYQPGQSLIGGGVWTKDQIVKESKNFFPKEATWLQESVVEFDPQNNSLTTDKNKKISYDYLIIATGLVLHYDKIDGLNKNMVGQNGISSIYFADGAVKTWDLMREFINNAKNKKESKALFTQPRGAIKCGGAPKKIAFLTAARLKEAKTSANIDFYAVSGNFFGNEIYNEATKKYFQARNMNYHFKNELISIDRAAKIATFRNEAGNSYDEKYDFIHIVPPMSAPQVLMDSDLALKEGKSKGYADTNQYTMQHNKFKNVFCIGDSSSVPTSKTGAAIREQYKVLGENLISQIKGEELKAKYNGYTACPLITDLGKVMMAEFKYNNELAPTLGFLDPSKERWFWWFVKVYILKPMYFYGMLKARA